MTERHYVTLDLGGASITVLAKVACAVAEPDGRHGAVLTIEALDDAAPRRVTLDGVAHDVLELAPLPRGRGLVITAIAAAS